MKKRFAWIPMLIVLSLLCGCSKDAAVPAVTEAPAVTETASPTAEPAPTDTPVPVSDTVSVTDEAAVENQTYTVFADSEALFAVEEGKLTLTGCSFDQTATSCGKASDGTLITQNGGTLQIDRCTVSSAAELVTAFACAQANVSVDESVLLLSGESALLFSGEDESELRLNDCMLSLAGTEETAFSLSESKLTLENTTVSGPEEGECTLAQLRESSMSASGASLAGNIAVHTGDCAVTFERSDWNGKLETFEDAGTVELTVKDNTTWTGSVPDGSECVTLKIDAVSRLSLTEDSYIAVITDEDGSFSNISGNGFNLYYNGELEANAALGSKTYALKDGGYLIPLI